MNTQAKAYRYARFSHSRQADGMSLERQADVAVQWAEQHGTLIDDSHAAFIDSGVSASRGKNLVKGAFARFRQAVAAGDVAPGSYLLVESVSRFSRLSPLDSQPVLRELVEAGIRVVFFDPSIEVTAENLHTMEVGMIFSIMAYISAEYANTLGRYKTKAWERAREAMRAPERTVSTRTLPYWLRCDATTVNGKVQRGVIEPHPVYAPVVRRIFAEYLAGSGKQEIAARLQAEKIAPPQREGTKRQAAFWRHGLIGRTLANPAVCGVFQPHKEVKTRITLKSGIAGALQRKRETAGAPIPDYYPRVISDETFAQAATVRDQNRARAGAKVNPGRGEVTHILARLACCPLCGSAMLRANKGKGVDPRYVCTRALAGKSGACERVYVLIPGIERALVENASVIGESAPGADPAINEALQASAVELAKTRSTVAALTDNMIELFERGETISDAMNAAHTKLEARLRELEKTHTALEAKALGSNSNVIRQRLTNLVSALTHRFTVQDMNAAMRECFERAVIDYRSGEVILHWRHGPPPTVVRYASA